MIDRLIVAFDGSELSREAFASGLKLARAASIELVGLHVIEPAPSPVLISDPVAGFDPNPILARAAASDAEECDQERRRFHDALAALGEKCARLGVRFTPMLEDGRLLEVLVAVAKPTDLIAIGMKGRFSRAGVGSSTKSLVQRGPCPVMVVGAPARDISRILAVCDGSAQSDRALRWSHALAAQARLPLSVLAITGRTQTIEQATRAADAAAPGAAVVHFGSETDDQAAQIEAAASHAASSLLVMGAYAESWLHQLFFGPTASQVLASVHAPVVLAH